jgi:asparagine synthase (glutamine-hydrolysing)
VAQRFKTDHQEVHLTEQRLLELLPQGIASLDQPTMDGINTYVVSKAVKDAGITVALSGLGGDELFAGYATFRRALRMQSISGFAKRVLRSTSGMGQAVFGGSVPQRKFWQLAASDGSPEAVYSITRQLFSLEEAGRISDCGLRIGDSQFAIRNPTSEISVDPVNAISLLEMRGYMTDTLLRDTDCTSMAHSLEVRVPFVDVEVVRYVVGLPGEWKVNGGRPKPLLADAVEDLFPPGFFGRPKMGFTLPFEKWTRSRLQDDISSVLDDEGMVSRAGLRRREVGAMWRRFLSNPKSVGWSRPWALFVLARWCELNGVGN